MKTQIDRNMQYTENTGVSLPHALHFAVNFLYAPVSKIVFTGHNKTITLTPSSVNVSYNIIVFVQLSICLSICLSILFLSVCKSVGWFVVYVLQQSIFPLTSQIQRRFSYVAYARPTQFRPTQAQVLDTPELQGLCFGLAVSTSTSDEHNLVFK